MPCCRVSICIPTYNGERYVAEAIRSACSQQVEDAEIVVSDSGSSDGTLDVVRREAQESPIPVRIVDRITPGMVANWNAVTHAAQGKYIKYLFQDDLLKPDCVSRMLAAAEADERIGMVFCRRRVIMEKSAQNSPTAIWLRQNENLSKDLVTLSATQPGQRLLGEKKLLDPPRNKVGEPTCVMVRRDVLTRVGPFNESMKQEIDIEMWYRLMAVCHVAFLDEPLATFRVHGDQMSVHNAKDSAVTADDWPLMVSCLAQPEIYRWLHWSSRCQVREGIARLGLELKPGANLLDRTYGAVRISRRWIKQQLKKLLRR